MDYVSVYNRQETAASSLAQQNLCSAYMVVGELSTLHFWTDESREID
jgi:hypothetical protein